MNRRQLTPQQQAVADAYNAAPPKVKKQMDLGLARMKAQTVASPNALFFLFPNLGNRKSLTLKDPSNG